MERAPVKTGHYAFDRITEADRNLGAFEDHKWLPTTKRRVANWYGRQYPPLKTAKAPTSQNVNVLMTKHEIARGFRPRFQNRRGAGRGLFGNSSSSLRGGNSLETGSTAQAPPWGGIGPSGSLVSNSSSHDTCLGGGLEGFGALSTNLGSLSTTVGRRSIMNVDSSLSMLSETSSSSIKLLAADYSAMSDEEARQWLLRYGFDADDPLQPQPLQQGCGPGRWFPIHKAAELGDLRMCKWIAQRASHDDLQVRDDFDYTPLNLASQNRRLETVRFLAGCGAPEVFKFDSSTLVKFE
jgi:hypothetical protein